MVNPSDFVGFFSKRDPESHKGTFGKCLCDTGSLGMAGAAVLSMRAALLCGVGLCRGLVGEDIYPIVSSSVPEAVFSVCKTGGDALSLLFSGIKSSDAVLIGCGKGNTEQTALEIGLCIEECAAPLVIDADGINALSEHINLLEKHSGEILLTPHPAEMARLINSDVKTVQQNRQKTASDFAKKYGVTVILKGHGTVLALKDGRVFINPTGNPGMATGGSGDVLSGMLVSFLAQGLSPETAAKAAVYIHGAAGDLAAEKKSQRSMLPSDILNELPRLFLEYEKGGK